MLNFMMNSLKQLAFERIKRLGYRQPLVIPQLYHQTLLEKQKYCGTCCCTMIFINDERKYFCYCSQYNNDLERIEMSTTFWMKVRQYQMYCWYMIWKWIPATPIIDDDEWFEVRTTHVNLMDSSRKPYQWKTVK